MAVVADILQRVSTLLDAAGIPFMVAGSFASSVYGQPRTTQDLDVVIDADRAAVRAFVKSLPSAEWYADEDAADDAVLRGSMFNLIDLKTGWKVDLVIRKDRDFSRSEFARRVLTVALGGITVPMATAEDTIIAKLEWSKASGGSERQRRDVRGIVDARNDRLDHEYLESWIVSLELSDEWRAVSQLP
jgi:hypothetical protein